MQKKYFFHEIGNMNRWILSVLFLFINGCNSSKKAYDFEEIIQQTQIDCKNGNYEAAIQRLETLEDYKHPQILELLAFTYEANQNLFKSAQTFSKAFYADLEKLYTEDMLYAAQIYEQLNYNEAAAYCYREYIEHSTKDPLAWIALAKIEEKLKHWEAALIAYLNSLNLKDEITSEESYQLAYLCKKSNLYEAAEFWLLYCLKTTKTPIHPLKQLLKLALAHQNRNKIKKFIQIIQQHDPSFFEKEPWKNIYETYFPKIILEKTSKPKSSKKAIEYTLKYFNFNFSYYPNTYSEPNITYLNLSKNPL